MFFGCHKNKKGAISVFSIANLSKTCLNNRLSGIAKYPGHTFRITNFMTKNIAPCGP